MRRLLPIVFATLAFPAFADTPATAISAEIGRDGLAKVETRLSALAAPTPDDLFALGGVQFLRAVEISFQDRWRENLVDRIGMLPLLRLPIPENPTPTRFNPAAVAALFTHAGDEFAASKATLAKLPEGADFGVEIALGDLWFDVNANGTKDKGEGILDVLGPALLDGSADDGTTPPVLPMVRFDTADASWLTAYDDLLMAFCDMVRAYDPTEALTRITTARAKLAGLGPITPDPIFDSPSADPGRMDGFDLIAVVLAALNHPPDKARVASARDHLLAMVQESRSFWAKVDTETDDNHEWLPNDNQHSALGVVVPKGTGTVWLGVLSDLEAVLNGKKLVPFWRVGPPAGLNLAKFFADPAPIDLAGWIQGWAALPYIETGDVVGSQSMDDMDNFTQGQSMLFALYLN